MSWNPWHYVVMLVACLAALLIAGKLGDLTLDKIDKATTIIISGLIGMAYAGRAGNRGRSTDPQPDDVPPRRVTPPIGSRNP